MPAKLELPRLTSSLREPFDVDSAYLQRKTILQNLLSHSSLEISLRHKIVHNWEEASPQVRQAYKHFVSAVFALIDREVASEYVNEVALAAYSLFGSRERDGEKWRSAEKRLELQKLLGYSVSDDNVLNVATLAQQLFNLQPTNHVDATASASNVNGGSDGVEFGADFDFQSPSRFLVDVSFDYELFKAEEFMVPSTSLSTSCQGAHNIQNHFAVDGAHYDLKWLRDVCDQIVRGRRVVYRNFLEIN